MRKQRMVFTMLAALALTVLCGCGGGRGGEPETSAGSMAPPEGTTDTSVSANVPEGSVVSGGKVFSLITMDTIDQFWLQVKEGAQAKADELGINLRFDAPVGKTDAQAQSDMVENAISNGVDGIIISPTNKEALAPAIDKAKEAGIPVVYAGTMCSSENYLASYTTDNYAAGEKAAQELAGLLGQKGQVAVICAQQGDDSGQQRQQGFCDCVGKEYPDMEVVQVVYSDGEAEKAMNLTTNLLATYPELKGIFSINEGSTIGMAQGLSQSGMPEGFACIGFDLSDNTRASIEDGSINGVIVQDPEGMGSESVEALFSYLENQEEPESRDTFTQSFFVTKDNLDQF